MLNYEVNETTDWETAYGEQHELYKATKKKLKKSRRKIKQLKKKKANAYGTEKRHIKRQLKAARNKVKALEKKAGCYGTRSAKTELGISTVENAGKV